VAEYLMHFELSGRYIRSTDAKNFYVKGEYLAIENRRVIKR